MSVKDLKEYGKRAASDPAVRASSTTAALAVTAATAVTSVAIVTTASGGW